jgi:putative methyltransferase
MKNLLLVQVVDKYGPNSFLPLAISYQWMYAQTSPIVKGGFKVQDTLISKKPPKEYLDSLDEKPDVIALSSYVWNWEYNRTFAKLAKEKWGDENVFIITGGPNVDKRDSQFFDKNPMFDIAVYGEGEFAFKEILERYLKGERIDLIPHVYPKGGNQSPLPNRIQDLEVIPSPILGGFYDPIMEKVEKEEGNQMWQVTYETLRGCPYQCAFCDIGDTYWQKIKKFDMDRVKAEIDWMSDKQIEYVSVCDSNWGLLERDKEITEYVIKKKLETGYPKFWDVTWAKSNSERIYEIALLDKKAKSRLFKGVTFAMQSLHEDTLKASKRFNVKREKANYYLELYQKNDIPTYSELIWPLPEETYDSLKNNIQSLIDLGQKDFLMVHPLVLTYNATMGQQWYIDKHGLKYAEVPLDTFYLSVDDLDNYIIEKTWGVMGTNTASVEETLQGHLFSHLFIVLYYYGWGHYFLEYMNNKFGYKHIDVVQKMLDYFKDNNTLISKEMKATYDSVKGVFTDNKFWGRQVLGEKDIFWEYKGATSIVFHQNRKQLRKELLQFTKDVYDLDLKKVVEFNFDMCHDYRREYPWIKKYGEDVVKNCTGLDSDWVKIEHWDDSIKEDLDFYHTAYHYQRKNRYWKCSVEEA